MIVGGTAIAEALILADEEFFDNNPNAGQPLRVLLVTDGEETQGGNPVQEAKKLRKKGRVY